MSNTELEQIVTNIAQRHANHLFHEALPHSIKELRQIKIAALREALEVVKDNFMQGIDHAWITHIKPEAIAEMEHKIRELELK